MVTVPADNSLKAPPNPPYPVTPVLEHRLPTQSNTKPAKPLPILDDDDEDDWERDDADDDEDWEMADKPEDVPKPLHVEKQKEYNESSSSQLPASLRVGPRTGPMLKKSNENVQAIASQISLPASVFSSSTSLPRDSTGMQSQNPYLKRQNTGEALFGSSSSGSYSQPPLSQPAVYAGPYTGPVELPAVKTPDQEFSHMNLAGQRRESQPPLIPVETELSPVSSINRHESQSSVSWNPGMDISSLDAMTSRGHRLPEDAEVVPAKTWQEQQEWDRQQRERREREAEQAMERALKAEQLRLAEEEWHQGEANHRAQEILRSHPDQPVSPLIDVDDSLPRQPLRATPRPQVPEFYSIKQVRWFDVISSKLRTSPILTQNDNGPCPLLALVNALVLSTPEHVTTGLVEVLRTREQVSLTLLLEAVLDELMSGRHGNDTQELPDVGELYDFLKTLHTGMNVNPRFTFVPDRASQEIHPAFRPKTAPGGFEETKEMRLYSTFNVPLVHGWLPPREDPAYKAFYRSAKTYEDAQNIQFGEEELEHKLQHDGLTPPEQQLFEDLHTIKSFLQTWPTQLTNYGLNLLHEHIKPGCFAILFRNDHFSTLYKEPRANQLMTLVTDAGYASHDEIIWESLVDINGQGAEMFSGDFRPVSHNTQGGANGSGPPAGPRGSSLGAGGQSIQSMLDVDDDPNNEWSTVQRGRGGSTRRSRLSITTSSGQQTGTIISDANIDNSFDPLAPALSRAEQEDHDLALALQLQEEEEDRARRESEARNRDSVMEGQGRVHDPRVTIPINGPLGQQSGRRRSSQIASSAGVPASAHGGVGAAAGASAAGAGTGGTTNRPPIPPRRTNREEDDLPPPTYEQAASRPAFVPPMGHPASPQAPVPAPGQGPPAGAPAGFGRGGGMSAGPGRGGYMGGPGRGRGIGVHGGRDDRDKCVIM
jgi:ubiquitin carboxyl-terminal hydrolase MINDY-1/2